MRMLLIMALQMFWLNATTGQPEYKAEKLNSLSIGYIYSSWENTARDYHIAEIQYLRTKYESGLHYFATTKYVGMEIGLNTERFTLGPKIGASINYGPIIFGAEIVSYTDFREGTLRIAPVFGFGNHKYNLSFSPQIRLINRTFLPTNQGQLNLTIRILDLKEEDF